MMRKIITFLRETVKSQGFERVIVSLSGGVDSATTAFLAVKALGAENVLAALLPHKELNEQDLEDARLVIERLGIPKKNVFLREIREMVEAVVKGDETIKKDKVRLGNVMARARMIILYDLAKKEKALVCGTENKSEHLLGYFTRFGDEASDLEPIKHLYKTEVIDLAKKLGVPRRIMEKPPSAGLWKGQTDEEELGFSYEEADKVLRQWYKKRWPIERIVEETGIERMIVEKVIKRVKANSFKRKAPYYSKRKTECHVSGGSCRSSAPGPFHPPRRGPLPWGTPTCVTRLIKTCHFVFTVLYIKN